MSVKIYALVCPISEEIRYIGKTERTPELRLRGHLTESRYKQNSHKQRWLRKLLEKELKPKIWILDNVDETRDWRDVERSWIARAVEIGLDLVNQTAGGEGLNWIDEEASAKHKEKLRKISKDLFDRNPRRRLALMEGNKRSWRENREARIKAISEAMTDEWKEKLAKAMDDVRSRPGHRERRSAAMKVAWGQHREKFLDAIRSEETLAKHRKRIARCWADPDYREKQQARWTQEARDRQAEEINSRREKMIQSVTPEGRKSQAEKMKEFWAKNPGHGKKCSAGISAEGRKRISEATKRRWQEYRARKSKNESGT